MKFNEFIKKRYLSLGLKQYEVEDALLGRFKNFNNFIQGRRPLPDKHYKNLAKVLKIDPKELAYLAIQDNIPDDYEPAEPKLKGAKPVQPYESNEPPSGFIKVIHYEDCIPCGPGNYVEDPSAGDPIPFDSSLAKYPEAVFACNAVGNSMWPRIHDGDIIFVSKKDPIKSGDIVLASVDGEVMCKRYRKVSTHPDKPGKSQYWLDSDNPDGPAPIELLDKRYMHKVVDFKGRL